VTLKCYKEACRECLGKSVSVLSGIKDLRELHRFAQSLMEHIFNAENLYELERFSTPPAFFADVEEGVRKLGASLR